MSWRKQFWENLSDPSSFNLQHELLKRVPEKLYRYRSDEEYKLKELQDSTVYLADPKSFNDPFESAYAKDFEYELKNLQKNLKLNSSFTNNHPLSKYLRYFSYKETLKRHQDMFRIACFCESPKDQLMWAHYANSNKRFLY